MNKKKKGLLLFGIITLILIIGLASYLLKNSKSSLYSTSCANHFIQLKMTLNWSAEKNPDFILPATSDTQDAIQAIAQQIEKTKWNTYQCCPESQLRDDSVGYVYIGDGLLMRDVVDKNILVLFCPGENHRGTSGHCHGWKLSSGGICAKTNTAMLDELKKALKRGESGEVGYSPRAMAVLRGEIKKREK